MTTPDMQQETVSRDLTAGSKAGSFPLFDWLRFVLASLVALDHSGWKMGVSGLSVQTFFALSGWLIGGILLNSRTSDLPRFFFKRGTRIWAPYFAAVAALYLVAAARDGISATYLHYLFHDVTFTHNWFVDFWRERDVMPLRGTAGGFWSISVEEQFYLAAPLIMLFLPRGKDLATWAVVALVAGALAGWNFQYLSITFGVLAAVIHRQYGNWHLHRTARIVLAIVAAASLFVIVGLGNLTGHVYNALAPFFSISVVLLVATEGRRRSVGVFLGGLSYPLYLNHWIGIFAANFAAKRIPALPGSVTVMLAYTLAFGVAVVAYLAIDRPIQLQRDKYYRPAIGKAFMTTSYVLCATGLTVGLLGLI